MRPQTHRQTYNDGFLQFGKHERIYSSTRKSLGTNFISLGKLAFSEMSARDQDYQMVDSLGRTLDIKVKTRYPVHFESITASEITSFVVRAKGSEYEVIKADKDRNKGEIFWYLQKAGDVNE